MTCTNCQKNKEAQSLILRAKREQAAKVYICGACRFGTDLETCQRSGTKLAAVVGGLASCPLGKHPDATGRVRFAALTWEGVPLPLRQVVAARIAQVGREADMSGLDGCGCSVAGLWFAERLDDWNATKWIAWLIAKAAPLVSLWMIAPLVRLWLKV